MSTGEPTILSVRVSQGAVTIEVPYDDRMGHYPFGGTRHRTRFAPISNEFVSVIMREASGKLVLKRIPPSAVTAQMINGGRPGFIWNRKTLRLRSGPMHWEAKRAGPHVDFSKFFT